MDQRQNLKTPRRCFEMLEILAERKVATFSQLAEELPYPRSTVHGYLQTMKDIGYVVDDDGTLRLSTRFLDFGRRSREGIPVYDVVKRRADELAERTGEHATFLVHENDCCIVAYVATGDGAVDFGLNPGLELPIATTAPGKAILSQHSRERVEEILETASYQISERERVALFDELEQIEAQGYAIDQEEQLNGLRGIAVPIVCHGTVYGVLAVGGPAVRFSDSEFERELPKVVREEAKKVEIEAVYSRSGPAAQ